MWVSGVGTHLSLCMYFRSFGIFEAIIWKAQPHALLLVKDSVLLGAEIFFHPFGLAKLFNDHFHAACLSSAERCCRYKLYCETVRKLHHSPHGSPALGSKMSVGTAVKNMCLKKELILILGAQVS